MQKTVIFKREEKDRFWAINKAEDWLRKNWYSFWSMARDMPIWIMKWKEWCIAKWYNLSDEDIKSLDGRILFKQDQVEVIIYDFKK